MTTPTTAAIRPASADDADAVADLIADAFYDLPQSEYLVPDPAWRRAILTAQFGIHVRHALGGVCHVDVIDHANPGEGPVAVSMWFDHTTPAGPPRAYDVRLRAATGDWYSRFAYMEEVLTASRPTYPHHFLMVLAVRPGWQRQGLGSALLDHHHTRRLGRHAAYLDAAGLDSSALYGRHGFEHLSTLDLAPGVRFWPMLRPAT
jgi:GNAT superfamily N-acetyltransferase